MMSQPRNCFLIAILAGISYGFMILLNALANIIPINGITTGQVSESYPNLFAPAGITFAIWGLIYLLLAGYVLYQIGLIKNKASALNLKSIAIYFSISSIANGLWIIAWHYLNIPLSMMLMIFILICLILISREVNKPILSPGDNLFVRLPFSIYFGWITVATIANATVLFVSLGWVGFEALWTGIIISVGLIIGGATTLKFKNIPYGLVIIWAYAGILIKHSSAEGFAGQYPAVIATTIVSILVLLAAQAYILFDQWKERRAV